LEHLSVKPGPKRLNFYGQTAIFAHSVRNCHFLSRPFTDRKPIFIDVSVTGSDFDKCNACSIGTPSSQSNLPPNFFGLFPSWKAIVLHTQKKPDDLQLIANHPVFQFEN